MVKEIRRKQKSDKKIIERLDMSTLDNKSIKELNRHVKNYFIDQMGGKCVVCKVGKHFTMQKRTMRRQGTYKKTYFVEKCNLEFDHEIPVCNSDYPYRIGRLNFGSRRGQARQKYFDLYMEECLKCCLKCEHCHSRGKVLLYF